MPKDQLFAAQIELLMRSLATDTVLAHAAGLAVALLLLWNVVDSELYAAKAEGRNTIKSA